jgi:PAS domain S-box-containing protein
VSASYESFLGYPAETIIENLDVWRTIVHPQDIQTFEDAVDQALSGHSECEFRVITADGATKWVRMRTCAICNDFGDVERISVFAIDITDYKKTERALMESRDTAWGLLNATSDMAMLIDTEWRILGINEAFARALGAPVGEVLGTSALEYVEPEIATARRDTGNEAIRTGLPVRFEDERNGRHFRNCFYPICDSHGQVTRVAVFVQDISDQKRVEDAQRLAAVGQLAAGVAHEFNNLLASMMMRAGLAAASGGSDDYEKLAETVLQMCERGSELTSSLMGLAQPRPPRKAPMDITHAIDAALAAGAQEMKGAGIEVWRQYDPDAALVLADAGQMEQVFLDLIVNACHAMGDGGALTISTNALRSQSGTGKVIVTVTDTGCGIEPDDLSRIFEPFFTTKGLLGHSDIPGTGLGLSVSHGIIKRHGGSIEAESRVGVGTSFRITLPAHVPAVAKVDASEGEGTRVGVGKIRTVLFADDEPALCDVIGDALTSADYDVTVVGTTEAALDALEQTQFDLVITDLLMPGGGGKAVMSAANALEPRPRVLIVTGRVGGGLEQQLVDAGADGCLQKPFTVPELLDTVTKMGSA